MVFLELYVLALCFVAGFWFFLDWSHNKAARIRQQKRADNHFDATERFRRGVR